MKIEFDKIDNLVKYTLSIESLYEKLYTLDKNGKKDSEEYKKILGYLKIVLETETDLYNSLNLNNKMVTDIMNYLFDDRLPNNIKHNTESIALTEYSSSVIRRIINVLNNNYFDSKDTLLENLPEDTLEYMDEISSNDSERILNTIETLYNSYESSILINFVKILEEYIKNDIYSELKDELLKAKYNVLLIDNTVGKYFLKHDKLIEKLNYDEDDDLSVIYNTINNYFINDIVSQHIESLTYIEDIEYNDTSILLESLMRQCLIKACLSLMDNNAVKEVKNNFINATKEENKLGVNSNTLLSRSFILDCFKYNKEMNNKGKKKIKVLIKKATK